MGGRGSSSNGSGGGGGAAPSTSTASSQLQALVAFEDAHYTDKKESVTIVDDNGNAVYTNSNGKSGSVGVMIPSGDRSKMIVTHNHPVTNDRTIGGPFSSADLDLVLTHGFGGIRATSVEGTYEFTVPANTKKVRGFRTAYKKADTVGGEIYQNAAAKNRAGRHKSSGTKQSMDNHLEAAHEWLAANASKYGYEYKFTPRGG